MRNDRGIALLVALILAVLLSLIGLSLTLSSMTSTRLSTEFESHERALMIAEAGQSAARSGLRGRDLDALLAQAVNLPVYLSTTAAPDGSPSLRNPRSPLEARSIDFEAPPGVVSSPAVFGLLTAVAGDEIEVDGYSGRYFAKLTDNEDEAIFEMPNDPLADLDGKVYLRVVGVNRSLPDEVQSHGGFFKNAVAVLETVLKRDMSFQLNSPLSVYGSNVNATFDGNSFLIDGYDHRGMTMDEILKSNHNHKNDETSFSGIGCLNDAEGSGDAATSVETIKDALITKDNDGEQLDDNVIGASDRADGTLSVRDDTEAVRNSDNPDATNIFNSLFLLHFAMMMGSVADTVYEVDAKVDGDPEIFGTPDAPKIVLAKGDLEISGSGSGTGVLIVQGKLNIQGAFVYDGVVLVIGDGELEMGGANKALAGGIYVVKINPDGTFGTATLSINGRCEFFMKSDSIEMGYSLLPMRVIAWREITSEIEPN